MRTLVTASTVATAVGVVGDAVLIEDGVVLAVGERADLWSSGQEERHYQDATIIPGLRDVHMHPIPYAALLNGCSLKQASDLEDLKERIATYAATLQDRQPVVATRLDDESLAEGRLPTRFDLDEAVSDRPVVIYRYCGHIAVANTAALRESGITADTPDPDGGTIDRGADGQPNGILRETAAGLISTALARGGPLPDDTLISALTGLAGLGITSIGAMIGYGERSFEQLEAELEQLMRIAPYLPIRVHALAIADTPARLKAAAEVLKNAGPRLDWLGVKRFADGSLGGHTAAMNAPFSDADTVGTLRLTAADTAVSRQSIELGGMVAIHAIGDRAIDGTLDVLESLLAEGADPADLRMEHVSIINPDQVKRFAKLGATAAVQPAFLASESAWIEDRIGRDRVEWIYPFRSLLAAGVEIAGSSDCPVEPPHPLWGMAAAMDRYGISPDEQLTGQEALAMFTSSAARALREPEPLGVGSPADLVVLSTNPLEASANEVHDALVLETYVDGVPVVVDRSHAVWPG